VTSPRQLGFWAVVALVALRLGIGWHFFKEGAKKFEGEGFTSLGFLQTATGPFADYHKSMIPDRFGLERLDLKRTSRFWEQYVSKSKATYGFDAEQSKQAKQILNRYKVRLKKYFEGNADELSEYKLEVQRFRKASNQPISEVPFQSDRLAAKEVELRQKVAPWLAGVKTFSKQLQQEIYDLGTEAQKAKGKVSIPDRGKPKVDGVVKYVVIGVGIMLILGLFSRLACLMGIGFLLTVMSTQPPWVPGANLQFFYYQMVEVLAMFTLIAFAAGRYAGLDLIIYGMYQRCCGAKNTA